MEMTTLIIVGVIVLIAIITIIGILSRYRKCKSDELLVVYGKTGSHKEKVNELDAKAAEILKEAEAKANATQMQLEAEGTKRKLLAEAEGKRASLMAEADKITAVEMAPAKAVEKMIECGMTPQMIVQYKTVDQLKGIAEASAEMYEHIHLGQVTVYGNENTAGSFMAKTAENLNPAFELLKSIPFKKTFKEMFVEDKKDNPTEDNFEAVK